MKCSIIHQGVSCLLRQNPSSEKEEKKIITCDPSICAMDHPDFIVCRFMEDSIGLKRGRNIMGAVPFEKIHSAIIGSHGKFCLA